MSHDTDQIAHSISQSVAHGHEAQDPGSRYDDLVIVDRPSLYSVSEPAAEESGKGYGWSAGSGYSLRDPRAMIDKLRAEISHLENWLAHQLNSRPRSLSMANTIRSLIATRKSLLENLLQKESQRR